MSKVRTLTPPYADPHTSALQAMAITDSHHLLRLSIHLPIPTSVLPTGPSPTTNPIIHLPTPAVDSRKSAPTVCFAPDLSTPLSHVHGRVDVSASTSEVIRTAQSTTRALLNRLRPTGVRSLSASSGHQLLLLLLRAKGLLSECGRLPSSHQAGVLRIKLRSSVSVLASVLCTCVFSVCETLLDPSSVECKIAQDTRTTKHRSTVLTGLDEPGLFLGSTCC